MKAALYNGPHDVDLDEIPTPEPGDDDVLIRNIRSGICGSDVASWVRGPGAHRLKLRSEFGHEMVSRVVKIGKNVKGFEVGQRVYPYPLLARGDISYAGAFGGFSEYILCPNPKPGVELYPVPEAISDKAASMIEPFTVATHAARQSRPQEGETALVYGCGTIGIGVAIALKHLGCAKVMVVDLSDFRLQKAAALGFETCNSSTGDLRDRTIRVFGAAKGLNGPVPDIDIFIDAAGDDVSLVDTYQALGKFDARMVMVAVYDAPVPVNMSQLAFAQHSITGSGGYRPEDVRIVLELMEGGRYDIDSIITQEFPLDRIVEALETAADRSKSLHVSIVY